MTMYAEQTYDCSDYPEEQPPFDYYDKDGNAHIMCACGHWVTGPDLGTKIALCPNCNFRASFGEGIEVKYPNRLPSGLTSVPADSPTSVVASESAQPASG